MVRLDDLSQVGDACKKLNPGIFPDVGEGVKKKRSKYRNVRQTMGGMSFDSGKEATDATNFMLAVRAGAYIAYLHHVRFPLAAGIVYEADHVLIENDLTVSVYDSKGPDAVITKEYRLKKKLFKEKYKKEIKEV